MKKILNKISYVLFVATFVSLIVVSCDKNNLFDIDGNNTIQYRDGTDSDYFAFQTNDVENIDGILTFKDTITYRKVINSLKQLNTDSTFINDYLIELGLTQDSFLSNSYPWNPAYQKFNERFNFVSLGLIEEGKEKQFLKQGKNPGEFNMHYIGNTGKRYMLNEFEEIRIGDDIIKYASRDIVFIVINNDMDALAKLRNSDNLIGQINVENVLRANINISEERNRLSRYFKDYVDDKASPPHDCDVMLRKELLDDNVIRIYGDVLVGIGMNYQWTIFDNNGQVVNSSDQDYFIDFEKPNPYNGPYTIELTVDIYDEFRNLVCTKTVSMILEFPPEDPCSYLNGQLIADGDVDGWQFDLYIPNSVNYTLIWDFGDGTVVNTNYYDGHSISHDYDDNDYGETSYEVCVEIVDNDNNCDKTICRTITTGCGYNVPDRNTYTIYKTDEMLKYRLIEDYHFGFGSWDKLIAKSKNYHKYHTIFGDFWWPKLAKYYFIDFTCNPVYSYCNPQDRHDALQVYSLAFYFDLPNYFTHVHNGSYANFYVGDGNQVYGPFYLAWR